MVRKKKKERKKEKRRIKKDASLEVYEYIPKNCFSNTHTHIYLPVADIEDDAASRRRVKSTSAPKFYLCLTIFMYTILLYDPRNAHRPGRIAFRSLK